MPFNQLLIYNLKSAMDSTKNESVLRGLAAEAESALKLEAGLNAYIIGGTDVNHTQADRDQIAAELATNLKFAGINMEVYNAAPINQRPGIAYQINGDVNQAKRNAERLRIYATTRPTPEINPTDVFDPNAGTKETHRLLNEVLRLLRSMSGN